LKKVKIDDSVTVSKMSNFPDNRYVKNNNGSIEIHAAGIVVLE